MTTTEPFRLFGLETATDRHRQTLAPVLRPFGPIPASIETRLGTLGLRAKEGDREAQNALFAAFAPRLDHWVRRAQGTCLRHELDPAIEPVDIAQEAFIVFVEILSGWSGEGSLAGYVIALFPLRLNAAVRRMTHARPRLSLAFQPGISIADDSYAGDEALTLLAVLADKLPERERDILLLRIRDGLTWGQIGARMEIDKRTALRDWSRILIRLRTELRPLL